MAVVLTKSGPAFIQVNMLAVVAEIETSPLWRAHCEHLASKGMSYARSIAPVDTGAYRDALFARVEPASVPDAVPHAPSVVIGNSCDHWVEVEFQEPMRYLPLLRTLDHLAEE